MENTYSHKPKKRIRWGRILATALIIAFFVCLARDMQRFNIEPEKWHEMVNTGMLLPGE